MEENGAIIFLSQWGSHVLSQRAKTRSLGPISHHIKPSLLKLNGFLDHCCRPPPPLLFSCFTLAPSSSTKILLVASILKVLHDSEDNFQCFSYHYNWCLHSLSAIWLWWQFLMFLLSLYLRWFHVFYRSTYLIYIFYIFLSVTFVFLYFYYNIIINIFWEKNTA